MVGFGTKSGKIAARFERQRNASGIINPSIFETFFFKPDISYLWKQFVNVPEIFFSGANGIEGQAIRGGPTKH